MPTKIITETGNFAEKKLYSVASATLTKDDFNLLGGVEIFKLPPNIFMKHSYAALIEPMDVGANFLLHIGTVLALKFKLVDGGKFFTGLAGSTYTNPINNRVNYLYFKNSESVVFTPKVAITKGIIAVIVEYIELDVGTATFTKY